MQTYKLYKNGTLVLTVDAESSEDARKKCATPGYLTVERQSAEMDIIKTEKLHDLLETLITEYEQKGDLDRASRLSSVSELLRGTFGPDYLR